MLENDGTWDETSPDEWSAFDDPIPLTGDGKPQPFPVDRLPGPFRQMVCATAANLSIPVDLAALTALGIVSTAIVGGVDIELQPGWRQDANLYLVGIALPGERKSPMMKKLAAPLYEVEKQRQEAARPAMADAETRRALIEKRRKKAIDSGDDQEAYEAARELAELPPSAPPRLMVRDITPEALIGRLCENAGRLGVVSDEGGEVFEMSARYASNGKANLGVYLSGWDGDRYTEDRNSREPRTIERTTLSMVLMVQPVVVEGVLKNTQMSGRGLAARYLWAYPDSQVGRRPVDTLPIPDMVSSAWATLVSDLADLAYRNQEPTTVTLTPAAADLFAEWQARNEARLEEGAGDLAGIADWGNKLPSQVGRLALVLHVAETRELGGLLQPHTMSAALVLADYFASHALVTFGRARLDEATKDAHLVLAWLRRNPELAVVATRDVQRGVRSFARSEQARQALEVLADHGFVDLFWAHPAPTGGSAPERWHVNPAVHDCGKSVTNVTNAEVPTPGVTFVTDSQVRQTSSSKRTDHLVFPAGTSLEAAR